MSTRRWSGDRTAPSTGRSSRLTAASGQVSARELRGTSRTAATGRRVPVSSLSTIVRPCAATPTPSLRELTTQLQPSTTIEVRIKVKEGIPGTTSGDYSVTEGPTTDKKTCSVHGTRTKGRWKIRVRPAISGVQEWIYIDPDFIHVLERKRLAPMDSKTTKRSPEHVQRSQEAAPKRAAAGANANAGPVPTIAVIACDRLHCHL